jgi:hypothetical protein
MPAAVDLVARPDQTCLQHFSACPIGPGPIGQVESVVVESERGDLVLAREWVVSLWIPADASVDDIDRLAEGVSDALTGLAAELSRQPGCGAMGLNRRIDVEC